MSNGTVIWSTPGLLSWPTADTTTQGWLANRWQRRDGNVYTAPAGRAAQPNSPIAGGPDSTANVYVPSGAPRS